MKNLEDKLQEACIKYFRYQYPDITVFSIPNGGSRNAIEAAKLKRTGTLAGVADLFVMYPKIPPSCYFSITANAYCGLFIELKVGKNQQTTAQIEFMENAQKAGYDYHVCHSIDEFMQIVNEYLK